MPLYNIRNLIGKTFVLKSPTKFYRVADVNNLGDKAKPVSNLLKKGYSFTLDSFLMPTDGGVDKYGIKRAKRSNYYWTFYGANGSYYAIIFNENLFDNSAIQQQGIKTVEQEVKESESESKSPFDKLSETVSDIFKGIGKTGKTLLIVGVSVWAVGYLMEKNRS